MALTVRHSESQERPSMAHALMGTIDAVVSPTSSLKEVRRQLAARNEERRALLRNLSHYNLAMKRSQSRNSLNS